jgi:hypothetical protein
MMASVKEHIILRLTDIGKEEYISVLDHAMNHSTHLNGMLHIKMHNFVVIYLLFYGGFLQAMQAELCFKHIQQNPMKGHYKDHEVYTKVVYNALKEYQLQVLASLTVSLEEWRHHSQN